MMLFMRKIRRKQKKQDLEVKKMEIELRRQELVAQKIRDDRMLQALISLAKKD